MGRTRLDRRWLTPALLGIGAVAAFGLAAITATASDPPRTTGPLHAPGPPIAPERSRAADPTIGHPAELRDRAARAPSPTTGAASAAATAPATVPATTPPDAPESHPPGPASPGTGHCVDDPPPQPAPGDLVLQADPAGRGCTSTLWWSADHGVLHLPSPGGIARYALGRPGDHLVLGDWSCDGTPTPALVPAAGGQAWLFDRWPTTDEELAARPGPEVAPGSVPTVHTEGTCDRLDAD